LNQISIKNFKKVKSKNKKLTEKMAKKGKGKKDPTAGMSEEEKIRYLQQVAMEEEKAKQQAAQVAMQFLKDKLGSEMKSVQKNENRLIVKWRDILRQQKADELKKDIQILSQTFERIIDRKSSVIEALTNDLEEAEAQHRLVSRQHDTNLEKVCKLHKLRINALKEEFQNDVTALSDEIGQEKSEIVDSHNKEMQKLQDVVFAMEHIFQEKSQDARQEFHSMKDEIKNYENEEKTALRCQIEENMASLFKQFQDALTQYNLDTNERRTDFERLKKKDDENSRDIDKQMKKIQKIQETILKLKEQMSNNAKEAEYQNKTLKETYENMLMHYRMRKTKMNCQREKEREKLTKVTLLSNSAIKKLTTTKEKAEKILRVSEMCRKMETEEEKVLPFYSNTIKEDEIAEMKARVELEFKDQLEKDTDMAAIATDYAPMDNFWKRYNKVLLDKLALKKEQSNLENENANLRQILKQYLDGISVNEETLANRNPLFVVNNRTNVNLDVQDSKPVCKTVVEAAFVVKHCL